MSVTFHLFDLERYSFVKNLNQCSMYIIMYFYVTVLIMLWFSRYICFCIFLSQYHLSQLWWKLQKFSNLCLYVMHKQVQLKVSTYFLFFTFMLITPEIFMFKMWNFTQVHLCILYMYINNIDNILSILHLPVIFLLYWHIYVNNSWTIVLQISNFIHTCIYVLCIWTSVI